MHASTRILVLLLTGSALVIGWWLLAVNNSPVVFTIYGAVWAAVVLLLAYTVMKIGFGYNRLSARRRVAAGGTPAGAGLAELDELRKRGLISADEYDDKRREAIARL